MKLIIGLVLLGHAAISSTPQRQRPFYPPAPPGYEKPTRLWSKAAIEYERQFAKLKSSVGKLNKSREASEHETARLLSEINANAGFLRERWNTWLNQNRRYAAGIANDRYFKSLTYLNQLLQDIEKETDERKVAEMLTDVAADLQIKADHCRLAADGLGRIVRVRILPKSGGSDVGGYQVCFAPKAKSEIKSAQECFRELTSPTETLELSPGSYALWARKGAVATKPVIQKIGGQGEGEMEVNLDIP